MGAGGKTLGKHTRARTEAVRSRRADDRESEAQTRTDIRAEGQTGETQRIAARVPAWPKPSKCKLRSATETKPSEPLVMLASELVIAGVIRGTAGRERLTTPSSATPGRERA